MIVVLQILIPYLTGVMFAGWLFKPLRTWQEGYDAAKKYYSNWNDGFDQGYKLAQKTFQDFDKGFGYGFEAGWESALENDVKE